MSYSELESAVLKVRAAGKMPGTSLFEIVAADSSGIDAEEFFDAVSRNLKRGRAVIAVVGDGIREDIIPLANLMQSHAGHRFTFALVELAVYEAPVPGVRLVVPSVLAQTELIERGVVRIEGDGTAGVRVVVEPVSWTSNAPSGGHMGIGEDEFFELLEQRDPRFPELLKSFLAKAEAFGVYADLQGGLNLKHTSQVARPLNMGTIDKGGIVDTGPSTWWNRRLLGRSYNEKLAKLIGGSVKETINGESGLRTAAGRMPRLPDLLPQHEQAWLDAMEQYILRDSLADSADTEVVSRRKNETVLQVGAEGGSITLLRERKAGGDWQFRMATNELATYDMLSEEDLVGLGPAVRETGYVHSFREALGLLDDGPRWFGLYPIEVHPEYLDAVLRAVRERGGPTEEARWREQLGLRRE
jgi:hypothetical protein